MLERGAGGFTCFKEEVLVDPFCGARGARKEAAV